MSDETSISDPMVVTARQLIDDANRRARIAEDKAEWAVRDLAEAKKQLKDFMLDVIKLDDKRPSYDQTAETLVQFIYDRLLRADDDDDTLPDMRDRCIGWLSYRLEQLIAEAVEKSKTRN